MTSPRDLADDLRVLRHPGTAGRDLEDWLAAERKTRRQESREAVVEERSRGGCRAFAEDITWRRQGVERTLSRARRRGPARF